MSADLSEYQGNWWPVGRHSRPNSPKGFPSSCASAVATMPPDNGNAPPEVEAGGANQGDQQGSGSTGKATLAADVRVAVHTRGHVRLGVGRSRVELSPYDALELAGRLELAALHAEQAGAA